MRYMLILWLGLNCTTAWAQTSRLDSARDTWCDTSLIFYDRCSGLATISFSDSTLTPESAVGLVFGHARIDTASASFRKQLGMAYFGWGLKATWLDHYDQALVWTQKAESIFRSLHDVRGLGHCHAANGQSYLMLGALGQVVPPLQQAIKEFEVSSDTVELTYVLENIAYALQLQGDAAGALQWCTKALNLLNGTHPQERAVIFLRMGAIQVEQGDAHAALATMAEAQQMVEQGLWTDHQDRVGAITGEALVLLGDCRGGLERLSRSLAGSKGRADRNDMQAYLQARIARGYLCAKEYRRALRSAREGLTIAEAHNLGTETVENVQAMAQAYEGLGDLRNALAFTRRYHALNDSLNGVRSAAAVTGALLNAEFQRTQLADSMATAQQREHDRVSADRRLEREQVRRNISMAAGGTLLIFLVVVYRQRRRIKKALRRSDELLLNILPEEVAEELKNTGTSVARHIEQATILFTDFKGFTEASEKLTPQELVAELNTCFKAFDGIITARGIEKIKTIGDAYMCAGGLPDPKSASPADVVHAALEMQAFMTSRKTERDAMGLPAFEMRVGIHTGPVVAGIVGVKKFQYDIWGDTVNTASRMESSGEVSKVNISEATYALVKDTIVSGPFDTYRTPAGSLTTDNQQLRPSLAFTFTPRGKVLAKGKGELEMYFVERN